MKENANLQWGDWVRFSEAWISNMNRYQSEAWKKETRARRMIYLGVKKNEPGMLCVIKEATVRLEYYHESFLEPLGGCPEES